MSSPFKFLDSYTKQDKSIFFGRDKEIEELYQKVFESKILLVYGISGTGKTSLINCGLANKFAESDWLPINIRRGKDINDSLANELAKHTLTSNPHSSPLPPESFREGGAMASGQQGDFNPQTPNSHSISPHVGREQKRGAKYTLKTLKNLYLDHFKPIYLIFDQFEEVFIFGSKEEREELIKTVKSVLESDIQCKFLFVLREEYLAGITEFERSIPEFFTNRIRIEKMTRQNAKQAIEGPCKVNEIGVEEGFSDTLLEKLSPESAEVELTYLQVYLDKIYRSATNSTSSQPERSEEQGSPNSKNQQTDRFVPKAFGTRDDDEKIGMTFNLDLLNQLGDVSDLLGSFLDEQIKELQDPDHGLAILKSFVSIKGTKKQITQVEVQEYANTLGQQIKTEELKKLLHKFVNLRILRDKDENGRYELRHDSLAAKIYEKITLVEKELLEVRQFIENAYQNFQRRNIFLSKDDLNYIAPYEDKMFLNKSLSSFINESRNRIEKLKRRKRRLTFASISVIAILAIFFGIYTFRAQKEAELQAKIEKSKSLGNKAWQYVESDPTLAYIIAEEAYNIYPTSEAERGLLNAYKNGPFYTQLNGEEIKISDSKKYILARNTEDYDLLLYDYTGNLVSELKGHTGRIMRDAFRFSNDEKHIITESIEDSTIRIWDIKGNQKMKFSNALTSFHSIIADTFLYVIHKDKYYKYDYNGELLNTFDFNDTILEYNESRNYLLTKGKRNKFIIRDVTSNHVLSEYYSDQSDFNILEFDYNKKFVLLKNNEKLIVWHRKNHHHYIIDLDNEVEWNQIFSHKDKIVIINLFKDGNTNYKIYNSKGLLITELKGDSYFLNNYSELRHAKWELSNSLIFIDDKTFYIKQHQCFYFNYGKKFLQSTKELKHFDSERGILILGDKDEIEYATTDLKSLKTIDISSFNPGSDYNVFDIQQGKFLILINPEYCFVFDNKGKLINKIESLASSKLEELINGNCLFWNYGRYDDTKDFKLFKFDDNYKTRRLNDDINTDMEYHICSERFIFTFNDDTLKIWDYDCNKISSFIMNDGSWIENFDYDSTSGNIAIRYGMEINNKNAYFFEIADTKKSTILFDTAVNWEFTFKYVKDDNIFLVTYLDSTITYYNHQYEVIDKWIVKDLTYIDTDGNIFMDNKWIVGYNIADSSLEIYDYFKKEKYNIDMQRPVDVFNFEKWDIVVPFPDNNCVAHVTPDNRLLRLYDINGSIIKKINYKGDHISPYGGIKLSANRYLSFVSFTVDQYYKTEDIYKQDLQKKMCAPSYFYLWDIKENEKLMELKFSRIFSSIPYFSYLKKRIILKSWSYSFKYFDFSSLEILNFKLSEGQHFEGSPNGNYLIIENDKTIEIFPLDPNEIIKRVREDNEFGNIRELTDQEKLKYGILN